MAADEGRWSRVVMFRASVDPLRCAIHASRKPGVAIHGHTFDPRGRVRDGLFRARTQSRFRDGARADA
jgi:hypothetical protein